MCKYLSIISFSFQDKIHLEYQPPMIYSMNIYRLVHNK